MPDFLLVQQPKIWIDFTIVIFQKQTMREWMYADYYIIIWLALPELFPYTLCTKRIIENYKLITGN